MATKREVLVHVPVAAGEGAARGRRVNLLPFQIKYSGDAKVERYFVVERAPHADAGEEADREQIEELLSSFRGRELRGREVKLKDGYVGMIFEHDDENDDAAVAVSAAAEDFGAGDMGENVGGDRAARWDVAGRFEEFVYWNRETSPSQDDRIMRWMQFLDVSAVLHEPLTEEKVAAENAAAAAPKRSSSSANGEDSAAADGEPASKRAKTD